MAKTEFNIVGKFDISQITKGLQDIKKQMSNAHIGEDLRKQFEQALNKVEVNIPALEKLGAKGEYNTKDLEAFQKLIQQVSKDMQALDKIAGEADFTKSFSAADTEKIKQFEKQLNEVENKIKSTRQEIVKSFEDFEKSQGRGNNKTLNAVIEQLISVPPDEIENKLDEIIKEAEFQTSNAKEELRNAFKNAKSSKDESYIIDFLFGENSGAKIKDKKKTAVYTAYNDLRKEIKAFNDDTSPEDLIKTLQKLSEFINNDELFDVPEGKQSVFVNFLPPDVLQRVKELANNIPELKKILGEENLKILDENEAEKLKITGEQSNFLKQRLDELVKSQKLTKEQADEVAKALGILGDEAKEGVAQINKQKASTEALEATFGSLAHRITSAVSAMSVFNKSMQIVRQAIKSVEDLDAAFTQIAIVSEQTSEQAWSMFNDFNKLAKQYSITTKDLTEGAKLFYQQGLNAADTMKMVEASTVSAALGEVTMTEAANTLTAAIQGYNESAAVAMDYTDKIAMVGAVSAADFNELSTAMEKTASSAYTAGIDFDHLLGYLGKMIEVTREAPANLGTAMKTIIARFEDMKKDPMAILEDGVSANKVEAALATIGIALRNSEGEFRALQDVMDELGMKWNSLTRNQQAYIATVAAGSRQQSRFLALMNNYDRTIDLITESQNSAGAAAEQYAIYQDSIAAAQARLTASWENFYSKIVDNSAIKTAINGLSDLIDALSHVPPAITAIGLSLAALQTQEWFRSGGAKNLLEKIFGKFVTDKETGEIKEVGKNIAKNFIDAFKDKTIEEIANSSSIWKALTESTERNTSEFNKLTNSLSGVKTSFITTAKVIGGFIAGNWQIIAIAALVTAAIGGITYVLNKSRREYEKSVNAIKKYREEAEELTSKANNTEKLLNTYDELISITNRTAEEQHELNSTIEAISEIYPEAITWVDEYGNSHLENSNILKEEIQLEKQLAKEKNRAALQERENLLDSDRKNWKKEDFSDIGFSNAQVDAYFKLQDELDYYQNIVKQFYSGPKGSSDLERNINSLQFAIENEEIDTIEAANLAIEEINKTIDKYHLNIEKLAKDSSWDSILAKTEKINYQYENTDEIIDNLKEQQQKIIERLQKDNSISLNFMDIVFSDKAGIATTQRSISAQLQSFFSSLGTEAYNSFIKTLPDGSLSNYVQKIIDEIDDADEGVEVKNLFEEAFNLSTSENRLKEIYKELGSKLGWEAGGEFSTSFQQAIEKNRQITRQNLEEAVRSQFGLSNTFPLQNIESDRLNSVLQLGKEGVKNYKTAYRMAPYYEEAQNLYEQAVRTGAIEGLEESFTNIDISKLDKYSQEQLKEIFKKMQEEAIFEATNEAFANLQKEAENFIKNTKEKLNKIQSDGRANANDYGLIEGDFEGVYFDTTSGEKMVSTARVLNDIEKENNKLLEDTRKNYRNNLQLIENIKNKGKEATDEDQKRLRSLEDQNEILIQQYGYYKKIANTTLEAGWNTSIKLAKNYQSQLQTISNLEKAMEEQGGVLFLDDMEDAMSILPEFQNRFTEVSDNTYTISAENIEAMKKEIKSQYDLWLAQEKAKATVEYENAVANYELIKTLAEQEGVVDKNNTEQFIENNKAELQSTKTELEQTLNASYDEIKQELNAHSEKDDQMVQMFNKALNEMGKNYETFVEDIKNGNISHIYDELYQEIQSQPLSTTTEITVQTELLDDLQDPEKQEERRKILTTALEEASQRVQTAWKKLTSLKEINVPELDKIKHQLEGASSGGKEAEESLKALADTVDDLFDALKDLDDLLIDIRRDLANISVDYNPFTELFEAWEKEWDYFYNIRRLMEQISTQAQYIDNLANAEYATADQRLSADHAKIGNILSSMSANDTYIEALRAGMSQTAVELMKDFGEYYKVDPTSGQIYQTDANLSDINALINQRQQEIYNLQKLQNEKENDLALENAKLEALEQEKSAYESILSTIESQYDSLKDNEDITIDLSQLGAEKEGLQVKIQASDASIDELKQTIRTMEDELQNIEVDIILKEQNESELENYVSRMEDKVQEYEEYWENLNNAIVEQQEHLAELQEMLNAYVDIAISTQQELYSAIVENYQDEINEKKKQYDYLKQLDNDYLNSLKDNINKQRQAREDANKQKSYQQNLQRAQLLQMDTSGAFRSELANVNKEIENQRQELYDDLVDKQVEALEKEIEKRHELYDKEVAALEERLAYMQENAILLWEMVNGIVAEGATAMMATLENTTAYINADELTKANQRTTWEYNVKKTFEGVEQGYINSIQGLINIGNTFVTEKYPEIEDALDDYTEVFNQAIDSVNKYNSKLSDSFDYLNNSVLNATDAFQNILDSFMVTWNERTNEFTGYAKNWETITNSLKTQTENNLKQLQELYNEQGIAIEENIGSIRDYDEQLRIASEEMYNDFLAERERYRDELNGLIDSIRVQIEGAIKDAADAIRNAANSISTTPSTPQGSGTPGSGQNSTRAGATSSGASGGTVKGKYKGYTMSWQPSPTAKVQTYSAIKGEELTEAQVYNMFLQDIEEMRKRAPKATFWGYKPFKTGGIADFTGPAWLDGSKSQPERILSPRQTHLFESMVSSLEKASNNSTINSALGSSYNIGDINTNINVKKLDNETDIDKVARQVENRIMKSIRNRVSIAIA